MNIVFSLTQRPTILIVYKVVNTSHCQVTRVLRLCKTALDSETYRLCAVSGYLSQVAPTKRISNYKRDLF